MIDIKVAACWPTTLTKHVICKALCNRENFYIWGEVSWGGNNFPLFYFQLVSAFHVPSGQHPHAMIGLGLCGSKIKIDYKSNKARA